MSDSITSQKSSKAISEGLPVVSPLTVVSGAELSVEHPDNKWLVRSLLPSSSCVFLIAEPKVGKSYAALDIALSVASGRKCFGSLLVEHTGDVAYVAAEDADWILGERLSGIARAKNCSTDDLKKVHIIGRSNGISLDDEESFAKLRASLLDIRPKLVVLDPLAQLLCRTNESNAKQMAQVLRGVRSLQTELDCTVLITHHTRKDGKGSINARSRGSSMVASWWDGCLLMEKSFNAVVRIQSSWKGFGDQPEQYIRLQSHNGGLAPMSIGHDLKSEAS